MSTESDDLNATKFSARVQVSEEILGDGIDLAQMFTDSLTKPTYGPRFVEERRKLEDDTYLDELDYAALVAEAKRLYWEASDRIDPEEEWDDVERLTASEIVHSGGHLGALESMSRRFEQALGDARP